MISVCGAECIRVQEIAEMVQEEDLFEHKNRSKFAGDNNICDLLRDLGRP